MVSGLTFKSLIHFKSIFVYGVGQGFSFILMHMDIQSSQPVPCIEELSFPHCIFLVSLSMAIS